MRNRHYLHLALRVGIGLGVYIGKLTENPWDLNGPAFIRARYALDDLKRSKHASTKIVTGGSQEIDRLLNAMLLLLDTILVGWTEVQWEAVHVYENVGTYATAGDRLGAECTQALQGSPLGCGAGGRRCTALGRQPHITSIRVT